MEDQEIKCAERGCEEMFLFTVQDQRFYAERGWNPPRRCKPHREAKNQRLKEREEQEGKQSL